MTDRSISSCGARGLSSRVVALHAAQLMLEMVQIRIAESRAGVLEPITAEELDCYRDACDITSASIAAYVAERNPVADLLNAVENSDTQRYAAAVATLETSLIGSLRSHKVAMKSSRSAKPAGYLLDWLVVKLSVVCLRLMGKEWAAGARPLVVKTTLDILRERQLCGSLL